MRGTYCGMGALSRVTARTDLNRAGWRRRQATKRAKWSIVGRCVECGGERKTGRKRCELCLIGNVIRVERCLFRQGLGR